jgi:hypothetical protein
VQELLAADDHKRVRVAPGGVSGDETDRRPRSPSTVDPQCGHVSVFSIAPSSAPDALHARAVRHTTLVVCAKRVAGRDLGRLGLGLGLTAEGPPWRIRR